YNLAREERLYVARGDREILREVASPDPSPSEAVQADDRLEQLTAGFGPREIEGLMLRRPGVTPVEGAERAGMNGAPGRRSNGGGGGRISEAFRPGLGGRP